MFPGPLPPLYNLNYEVRPCCSGLLPLLFKTSMDAAAQTTRASSMVQLPDHLHLLVSPMDADSLQVPAPPPQPGLGAMGTCAVQPTLDLLTDLRGIGGGDTRLP